MSHRECFQLPIGLGVYVAAEKPAA